MGIHLQHRRTAAGFGSAWSRPAMMSRRLSIPGPGQGTAPAVTLPTGRRRAAVGGEGRMEASTGVLNFQVPMCDIACCALKVKVVCASRIEDARRG